jgi:hypothetical protein
MACSGSLKSPFPLGSTKLNFPLKQAKKHQVSLVPRSGGPNKFRDPFLSNPASPSLKERLLAPLRRLFPEAKNQRSCPAIPDESWIEYGLERGLTELESGLRVFAKPPLPPRA